MTVDKVLSLADRSQFASRCLFVDAGEMSIKMPSNRVQQGEPCLIVNIGRPYGLTLSNIRQCAMSSLVRRQTPIDRGVLIVVEKLM
jgi:hypothetical protein